jgi:hypothetical protein
MKIRMILLSLIASLFYVGVANATELRVVVVQTADVTGYVKSIADGQAMLKSKGSPAVLRVWVARYAGENAGSIIVSVEYPTFEALAKDDTMMRSDADLRAWLAGLAKMRKIVSDSIYEELKP